ncbi:MAG TPA: zf-HC2 domain-containing protein [Mycobacteriales bacterium]|nr:zf-HC2 domain-containing protein [Mycobacteriales bacterium]
MSSHLDDWAASLVDAELAPAERDRALAHLAGCADCQAEVDVQRRVKSRLAPADLTELPAALTARLLAIPVDSGPTAPTADVVRRSRLGSARPAGARPWSRSGRPVSARPRSPRRVAAGSLGAVTAAMALAVLAGGEAQGQVRPPVGTYVVEHTATTTQLPLNDMVADIVMISTR